MIAQEMEDNNSGSSTQEMTTVLLQLVLKVTDVLSKNNELQNEVNNLKMRNADLTREMEKMEKSLTQRIEMLEDKSGEWASTGPKHFTAPPADVNALTSSVADELEARNSKTLNLVIVGLDEEEEVDASENDVMENVNKLLRNIDVQSPNITRVFRMGRRNANRPRPVKVFCGNADTRSNVLNKAKKLKDLPLGHQHKKVFIRPDLTQLQRDQDFQRRQERRRDSQPRQMTDQHQPRPQTHNRNNSPDRQRQPPALHNRFQAIAPPNATNVQQPDELDNTRVS